ncbi:MAG: AP2 domain-containing protein [Planctomycetota bacterium]
MKQGPEKRNCSNCYFSRPIADKLHCVRNPPALDTDTGQARWPAIKQNDICGQFRYADEIHIDKDHWPKNELPIYKDHFSDYCKIPLTQGKFAKVDPEDYIWLSQFRWHCKINKNAVYAARTITSAGKQKRIYMHRLIANTPPHLVCDHINHIGLDNRKANLRNCTLSQNNANARSAANASSKYKGVSWNKKRKKWAAYIKKDSKQINLGNFNSEIQAAKAYDQAAKKYHGEFAALNFPPQIPEESAAQEQFRGKNGHVRQKSPIRV